MRTLIVGLLASTAILRMMPDADTGGPVGADPTASPPDPAIDRIARLKGAVDALDDANDGHWLDDGKPLMAAVEAIFGATSPTREEVDAIGRVRQRSDGPTVAEYVAAGYKAANYPPAGYASKSTAEEIAAAVAAETTAGDVEKSQVAAEAQAPIAAPAAGSITETNGGPISKPLITKGRLVFVALATPIEGETEIVGIVAKVNEDGSINVRGFSPGGGVDPFFSGVLPTEYVDGMVDGADKNAARSATWGWPPRT